jgi:hypothetical protein
MMISPPHSRTTLPLTVLVALTLGGCPASVSSTDCTTTADCARGESCVAMRCRADELGDAGGADDAGPPAPRRDAGPLPDAGPGSTDAAVPCGESTFEVTETMESVIVPNGVRYMHIKAWGSGGNGEGQCGLPDTEGGPGGYTEGVYAVSPGTELVVIVGYPGSAGTTGEDAFRFGWGAHGGGGLSGVFRGPVPITDEDRDQAIVIAGGGGSAGAPDCHPGGPGNHPDAGGMPTMMGAYGEDPDNIIGGGGGYEGGSPGDLRLAAHGGTGFVSEVDLLPDRSRILHSEPGSGAPPNTDDPDYDGTAGTTEVGGQVVIRYLCEPPPPLI